MIRRAALSACLLAAAATPARAQVERPLPIAAADARVVFAGLGQDAVTARDLVIEPAVLPSRGMGIAVGLHVYPLRGRRVALGIGGELLMVRGGRDLVISEDPDPDTPPLPAVRRRLGGLSGQLSLNFGHREGWSYLTAGFGALVFATSLGDAIADDPPRKNTINLGGGARWFTSRHVALNLDARFYLTRPDDPVGVHPGRERLRVMVLSVGVSVK